MNKFDFRMIIVLVVVTLSLFFAPFAFADENKSEIIFLGSVGFAGSSGYEFPVVGVLTDVNLRIGRYAIVAGGGWDPRARKVGTGDGWRRNLGAGLQVYFRERYFVQFDVSRTEQFTSKWQKQFTWVGGDFGYKNPKFEMKLGICQDIESFNGVFAFTYGTKWYFPLSQSESWGFTAGYAGSIIRFQRRNGEERLTASSIEALGGLFFRF
jgi:hypothetical protein